MGLLRGIFETHLPVNDLDRAMEFYGDRLGLELGLHQPERRAAFYFMHHGEKRWMLGLFEVEEPLAGPRREIKQSLPGSEAIRNTAFRVAVEDVDRMVPWLHERGIEPVYPPTAPVQGPMDEPVVHGWMPAAAVFFEDPDGHWLELIADLSDPPRDDFQWRPLSEWKALSGNDQQAANPAWGHPDS